MVLFYFIVARNTPGWDALGTTFGVYGWLLLLHPQGVMPRYRAISAAYFPVFSKNKSKIGKHSLEEKWGGKQNLALLLCGEKLIPVQQAFCEEMPT